MQKLDQMYTHQENSKMAGKQYIHEIKAMSRSTKRASVCFRMLRGIYYAKQ